MSVEGRSMDLDAEAVERVEAEIDSFIQKRAREKADANEVDAFWAEQERCDRQRKREANRQAWIAFHRGLARSHAALSESHEERAVRLAGEGAA
jgi:hypothetical protein